MTHCNHTPQLSELLNQNVCMPDTTPDYLTSTANDGMSEETVDSMVSSLPKL